MEYGRRSLHSTRLMVPVASLLTCTRMKQIISRPLPSLRIPSLLKRVFTTFHQSELAEFLVQLSELGAELSEFSLSQNSVPLVS